MFSEYIWWLSCFLFFFYIVIYIYVFIFIFIYICSPSNCVLLKFTWKIHSTLKTRSSTKFWFTTIRCSSELKNCARTWISWWWAGDEVCCERWPAFSSLGVCGKRSLLIWSLGWASLPWGVGITWMVLGLGEPKATNRSVGSNPPQRIEKVNSHHCCWNFWNYDIFYFFWSSPDLVHAQCGGANPLRSPNKKRSVELCFKL